MFHQYFLTLFMVETYALPSTQALQKFQVMQRLTRSPHAFRQGQGVLEQMALYKLFRTAHALVSSPDH